MIVAYKTDIHLDRNNIRPPFHAVQGDSYTRQIEMTLKVNENQQWEIPDGVTAKIRYKKEDGTTGEYDTLPDGNPAYTLDGNVFTITLAAEVLDTVGSVVLQPVLVDGDQMLSIYTQKVIVLDPTVDPTT